MWRASIGVCRRRPITAFNAGLNSKSRLVRRYNGPDNQIPHTTYFQQPPPPPPRSRWRIFRTILLSTTFFGLGAVSAVMLVTVDVVDGLGEIQDVFGYTQARLLFDEARQAAPSLTVQSATALLELMSMYNVQARAVTHACSLPSNSINEDESCATSVNVQQPGWWDIWGVFDGHAGTQTSALIAAELPPLVFDALISMGCLNRPYTPNDLQIIRTIKDIFLAFDNEIITLPGKALPYGRSQNTAPHSAAAAFSGSCALLAMFDPLNSVLRVANVGDSRAVIGRWDPSTNSYRALPMSIDQTGFNPEEIARIEREHPGEDDIIDPATGRVHGLMVSRAFGDARWKWPASVSQYIHERFYGPEPLAAGKILTPPYLTAEPDILETKIQTSDHPDFLIMASDGLWDNMSSDDAVTCVQMWLDRSEPDAFIDASPVKFPPLSMADLTANDPNYMNSVDVQREPDDEDTYYDPRERCRKWHTSPKHFVVEDPNCAVHLVKNALGGKRRRLFTELVAVQPPVSRNVRDDITVQVVFFGGQYEYTPDVVDPLHSQYKIVKAARTRS